MSFINPGRVEANRTPLPPNDQPETDPPKAPELSPKRKAAIDKLLAGGKAKSVAHAVFLSRAGCLELPD